MELLPLVWTADLRRRRLRPGKGKGSIPKASENGDGSSEEAGQGTVKGEGVDEEDVTF